MATIREEPDCGNAPRKKILRDFIVALTTPDSKYIASLLADDIAWTLVGGRLLTGLDAVKEWVPRLPPADQVTFGSLLTHGHGASVDGLVDLADGTSWGFCHVLRFAGAAKTAKIVGVKSYVINIMDEPIATLTAQL